MNKEIPQVCIIAGSDPIGGAGIQADLRMAALLGCSASSVITCVTVQDLKGVYNSHYVPQNIIDGQLSCALSMKPKAIKIGMLGDINVTSAVLNGLKNINIPIVLDPVLVSTSRSSLLKVEAFSKLVEEVIPKSYIITPNMREAEILSGSSIKTEQDMHSVAEKFLLLGAKNVLIKGFKSDGKILKDLLLASSPLVHEYNDKPSQNMVYLSDRCIVFSHPELENITTHGTGCRLSSSIACYIAKNATLVEAVYASILATESEILRMQSLYTDDVGIVQQ